MSDGVLTSETSSQASSFDSDARIICRVCEKQFSQYTCPRCYTRYCSLPCYKSHSLRCTESFTRENVMEEMKLVQHDEETKSKMLDILKRFHEEEENDSMDEDETDPSLSEETLQKILAGDDISIDDLSPEEKKRFQQALASGELSKLIEPWEPWWLKPSAKHISLSSDGTQLIQPMENDSDNNNNQFYDIPRGPDIPLAPLSKLMSSPPSPQLVVHLVDIIYSYCFTLRLYNGEWRADPLEASTSLLTISSVLGQNRQPQTVPEALSHCLEQTCSSSYKHMGGGPQLCVRLMEDVGCLLYLGGSALICLLCDAQRLIQASKRDLKLEKLHKSKKIELKNKLNSTERKIYFMTCWVYEQPFGFWTSLGAIVDREKAVVTEHMNNMSGALKPEDKSNRGGKPLIKEL